MKYILLIILIVLQTACATKGGVSHWRGESLSSLIEIYGTPDSFLKLGDGSKVLEYDKGKINHITREFCTVTFFIDPKNRIKGVKGHGNGTNCLT